MNIFLSPIYACDMQMSPALPFDRIQQPAVRRLPIQMRLHFPMADCFIYAIKWYLMRGLSSRPWQSAKTQSWGCNNRRDSGKGRHKLVWSQTANQRAEIESVRSLEGFKHTTVSSLEQEMFNREKEHKLLQKRIKQGLKISWRTKCFSDHFFSNFNFLNNK